VALGTEATASHLRKEGSGAHVVRDLSNKTSNAGPAGSGWNRAGVVLANGERLYHSSELGYPTGGDLL